MERRAFEAALRAAAKITFGTGLLGCGGSVVIDAETNEGGGHNYPAPARGGAEGYGGFPSSEAGGGAGGSSEPSVCAQPPEPPSGWGSYDEATFGCCVARIAAIATETPPEEWRTPTMNDPDISNCCQQILGENSEALWSGAPLPHPAADGVIGACCVYEYGNSGCTPWGPPVPVAMDPADYVPWVLDALGENPVRDMRGAA